MANSDSFPTGATGPSSMTPVEQTPETANDRLLQNYAERSRKVQPKLLGNDSKSSIKETGSTSTYSGSVSGDDSQPNIDIITGNKDANEPSHIIGAPLKQDSSVDSWTQSLSSSHQKYYRKPETEKIGTGFKRYPTDYVKGVPQKYDTPRIDGTGTNIRSTWNGQDTPGKQQIRAGSDARDQYTQVYEGDLKYSTTILQEEHDDFHIAENRRHSLPGHRRDSFKYRGRKSSVRQSIPIELKGFVESGRRRSSAAKNLTLIYNVGPTSYFDALSDAEEKDEDDELVEELLGEVEPKPGGRVKRKNIRAGMNCCSLLLHDFKSWRMRKRKQHEENPFFKKQIRIIEGQFGSGIVSFFIFLRWVFLLNAILGLLWAAFIVLPQALDYDYNIFLNDTVYFRNLFDAENVISETWMFYGAYKHDTKGYPTALVYLICTLITYFGGFFLVVHSIASAIKSEGVAAGGPQSKFGNLLFTSWDYSLTNREASRNLSMGISNTFRDLSHEIHAKNVLASQSRKDKIILFLRRALAWLITLILVGGGSGAIFFFIRSDIHQLLVSLGLNISPESIMITYAPTVTFIVINSVIPKAIFLLPMLEGYVQAKRELYITIGRVFVFRMVNLMALVASLYEKVDKGNFLGCAGTLIGKELYKLVIVDTIVQIGTSVTPNFVMFYWTGEKTELKMPPLVLKIVYRQSLIMLGTLVCPVMPLIGMLSMAVMFATSYITVKITCKPPTKRWNQPRRSTFFMGLTAATLVMLIIPVSFIIGRGDTIQLGKVGTSDTEFCGPFGNETMLYAYHEYAEKLSEANAEVASLLDFILSPTVITPMVFIMFGIIYFQHLRTQSAAERCDWLQAEIAEEKSINKVLLKRMRNHGVGSTHTDLDMV